MIGTLVLYGLAFVGACVVIAWFIGLIFDLPRDGVDLGDDDDVDPGVIDEQRHEYEHAQWRNNVRTLPTATVVATFGQEVVVEHDDCTHCGEPMVHACNLDDFIAHQARLSSGGAS
jgi:hypothetical protein